MADLMDKKERFTVLANDQAVVEKFIRRAMDESLAQLGRMVGQGG